MACLIKLPNSFSKGIVSFTTQEEVFIRNNPARLHLFKKLKEKYVVCLHYNWHNFNCKPDSLFDIHLAGNEDLVITNNQKIFQIGMDACNFVRPEFKEEPISKTWDILFIGNPVFFKDPLSLLKAIRELYNKKLYYRALYVCPMPPFKFSDRSTVVYNVRKRYEKMFNEKEQQLFNHLLIRENYPRFFDRQTLSGFYKLSKIFVHTAPEERRCRVAAYAWARKMPVVGKQCVGSLLPPELRKPPFFYEVSEQASYSEQIQQALSDIESYKYKNVDWTSVEAQFLITKSTKTFEEELKKFFKNAFLDYSGELLSNNLDHRLGWHHGFGKSTNTCNQNLDRFMVKIMNISSELEIKMRESEFPEECLIDPEFLEKNDLNEMPFIFKFKKSLTNIKYLFKTLF